MIVFDLDGTLALDHHRTHYLRGDVKYWDEYFNACLHDEPNRPILEILKLYAWAGVEVAIWTGRSAKVRDLTLQWLDENNIRDLLTEFRMRDIDDRTQDDQLKQFWLNEVRSLGKRVDLVFEDRQRVVDMWRSEGIVCCQVAPGNF
jgi:phosphoglycolate phosphatase-like HAD superfamily hydrolase